MAIKFKGCPKCQGDLYLSRDMYGKYMTCLQCGYLKDLVVDRKIAVRPVVAAGGRQAA